MTTRAQDAKGRARRLWLAACAVLIVLSCVWLAVHIRLDGGGRESKLAEPVAADRAGERMEVPMPTGPVRVNTAAEEELCALPGVGPAMAQAIVLEREGNGLFYYPEDLLNVKGIGEKKLAGMLEWMTLETE